MEFRPCIDIHNGKVKQIVGGSLKDAGYQATENFVAEQDAAYFAKLYQKEGIKGGHIILLNPVSSEYYKATGRTCTAGISRRTSDRWWSYSGKCKRVSGCRSESCDRYFVCVPGWKDQL